MKELSIEEKAKAYDEAIKKLRSLHDNYDTVSTLIDVKEELEDIFPELKESEDERIRKEIKQFIRSRGMSLAQSKVDSWIAWLEKQGEPSNIIWNKVKPRDYVLEKTLIIKKNGELDLVNDTILSVTGAEYALPLSVLPKPTEEYNITGIGSKHAEGKLGEMIKEMKPAEWSEEDERIKNNLLSELTNLSVRKLIEKETEKKYANWLKSLRPQNTWKPTEEQMEHLSRAFNGGVFKTSLLMELYQDLKKLKG